MEKSQWIELLKGNVKEAEGFWKKIVDLGGCAHDTTSMNVLADVLKAEFEKLGMTCNLVDAGESYPPLLVGELPGHEKEKPILFSGHYDTVFPFDTYAHPAFRIDDESAYGPGVLDMKGGIAITWLIIKTLIESKESCPPLKILFVGDEETDRIGSNTVEHIMELASDCKFAFNMETGNMDRSICVCRKGVEEFEVTVNGVSSHPGNYFDRGRNAIEEAARKILLLQELTAEDFSYTVNVGTIHAGTVSNIIPDLCTFKLETRFQREADRQHLEKEIKNICQRTFIEGTSTQVVSTGMLPPFETHEKEIALYEFMARTARKYGLPVPEKRTLGGASDAAYICQTNTPVVCAMGVCGENNHSPKEYADIASFLERAEFLLYAVLDHEDFEYGKEI